MLFKKLPIVIQLICMLILTMVIPTTIIVYYSSVSLSRYSENEVAQGVLSQLKSNSQMNERELFNLVQNVLTIVENSNIRNMKGISSYEVLNENYTNISKGLKLYDHLRAMDDNSNLIASMAFIPEDWDYMITSDKGIIRKEQYTDLSWLKEASEEMQGVSGYWYPRMEGTMPVITYLYRLNRLTTSVKGFITVDIYESKVCDILNYGSYKTDSNAFLLQNNGDMISNKEKSILFKQAYNLPYVEQIMDAEPNEGYFYLEENGERILCAYSKVVSRDWIYGVTYSMEKMLTGVDQIRRSEIILMLITMALSSGIVIVYAVRFARPMRQLAGELKKKNLDIKAPNGNEITWLIHAFEDVEKQEEKLYETLRSKEGDTKSRVLHNLLAGEIDSEEEKQELDKLFPYKLFIVAVIVIDSRKAYLEKLNAQSRSYQRYLLLDSIEKSFPEHYKAQATRYDGGCIAVIMNMEGYDQLQSPRELSRIFSHIQKSAKEIFKHTVSIGISGLHSGYEGVNECAFEAMEAVTGKMLQGANSILFWKEKEEKRKHYYYPYEHSEKITNYLSISDLKGIQEEIEAVVQEIIEHKPLIEYENIKMVFNQLSSIAVKFMVEHQMNIGKVLGKQSDIYTSIADAETLEELKEGLIGYYSKLIEYLEEQSQKTIGDGNYQEKIIAYLNQHYKEDLVYEEVAEEIGISYSYLRRIVKEETGKSPSDYINKIRIEEVKRMLLETDLSLNDIATAVGYHNVQSVLRYFRKYEGITPKEFKQASHL